MENTALILIGIAIILLIIVMILLSFLVFNLLKERKEISPTSANNNSEQAPLSNYHPDIVERIKSLEFIKKSSPDLYCPNHTEEPGEVTCVICDRLFCKSCVKPFKSFHLCKEHLPLMMRYEWDEVVTVKTSTEDPERGVRLYDLKKELYMSQHHATYIETHYKINVENDYIETYLVLFAIKEEMALVKDYLSDKM